jgi:tripartite-type tricarboxylate transporter receptor subunit TctC
LEVEFLAERFGDDRLAVSGDDERSGVKGFEITAWFGFLAPAGTPKAIIDKVSADVKKVLAMPEVRQALIASGAEPVGSTPDQFGAFIKAEGVKMGAAVKRAGITPQ